MKHFTRLFFICGLILICALNMVNSSSGVSQFSSEKNVSMSIADSEDAFIAVPDVIHIKIDALKQITKYFDKEALSETELNETYLTELEPIKTEEVIKILDVSNNLTIKNNLNESIELTGISFDSPFLQAVNDHIVLGVGNEENILITLSEENLDLSQMNPSAKAELYLRWNSGNAILYKEIDIEINLETEIIESYIEEENVLP